MLAVAAFVIAGCAANDDEPTRSVDEEAWRASVEEQLRGDDGELNWDGRQQKRLPTPEWEEFAEFWVETCGLPDGEFRQAIQLWADDSTYASMARTNVRYACPDRMDTADDALKVTTDR